MDSRASGVQRDVCFGGELVNKRESAAALAGRIVRGPPSAVVGDGNENLAVGDASVQPHGAWCRLPGKGVVGGIDEGFVHRESEVVGGVAAEEGLGPTAERPPQRGGVLNGCRYRHVQLLRRLG